MAGKASRKSTKAANKAAAKPVARKAALLSGGNPQIAKAVKWNSPFYGVEGQGWFLSFHV